MSVQITAERRQDYIKVEELLSTFSEAVYNQVRSASIDRHYTIISLKCRPSGSGEMPVPSIKTIRAFFKEDTNYVVIEDNDSNFYEYDCKGFETVHTAIK